MELGRCIWPGKKIERHWSSDRLVCRSVFREVRERLVNQTRNLFILMSQKYIWTILMVVLENVAKRKSDWWREMKNG